MTYVLHHGDCLEVMPTLEANSVDTIITDPPYHLTAGKKGGTGEASLNLNSPAGRSRVTTGFMGKVWDAGDIAFRVDVWREALRVAKPGAMLLAFGGTRTFHRLTCAIEDAGWEVRDVVSWLYGSGFPKSLDISKAIDKAIDKAAGEVRDVICLHPHAASSLGNGVNMSGGKTQDVVNITAPATPDAATWAGWGTALKPAWEPVILAMKPLDGTFAENALAWGVAGLNVDGARIGVTDADHQRNASGDRGHDQNRGRQMDYAMTAGHASSIGRWPANLLLDEDAARALDAQSGVSKSTGGRIGNKAGGIAVPGGRWEKGDPGFGDTGDASRFFYVAKASRAERNAGLEGMPLVKNDFQRESSGLNQDRPGCEGRKPMEGAQNFHPTVKPLALMRYLCRLTSTPTGGVVLDPFMGSGTTGVAALMEGRAFIGIEREAEYVEIAQRRIAAAELPLLREAAD